MGGFKKASGEEDQLCAHHEEQVLTPEDQQNEFAEMCISEARSVEWREVLLGRTGEMVEWDKGINLGRVEAHMVGRATSRDSSQIRNVW